MDDAEIARIATYLGLADGAFIERFTRLRRDRRGLSLVEKPNGECHFLDGGECAIQPVKPQQCRDFPNLWNFPGFEQTCRSKAIPMDAESYIRRVAEVTGRSEEYVRRHPGTAS